MDQRHAQWAVRQTLTARGFRPVHETSAVTLLANSDYPGVTVRMGTTRVIAERHRRECYRSRISDFDLDELLASIVNRPDSDDLSEADRA